MTMQCKAEVILILSSSKAAVYVENVVLTMRTQDERLAHGILDEIYLFPMSTYSQVNEI